MKITSLFGLCHLPVILIPYFFVETLDVYGEDADEDNVHDILKWLSESLKLKLIDELPVVKGKVEHKYGKDRIRVDMAKKRR